MGNAIKKTDVFLIYGEYCSWSDDEQCELINGVIYDMIPAPSKQHADILGELFYALKDYFSDKPCIYEQTVTDNDEE